MSRLRTVGCGLLLGLAVCACGEKDSGGGSGGDEVVPGEVPAVTPLEEEELLACGSITAAEVRKAVTHHVQAVLGGTIDRLQFLNDSALVRKVFDVEPDDEFLNGTNGHESLDELTARLEERYFADALAKVNDDGTVTFTLKPEISCPDPVAEADWTEDDLQDALDEQTRCRESIAADHPKVTVRRVKCDTETDSVVVDTFKGTDGKAVSTWYLAAESLQVDQDMSRAGEDIIDNGAPESTDWVGSVSLRLALSGSDAAEASLTLRDGFAYNYSDDEGFWRAEAGGDETISWRADATAKELSGKVALQDLAMATDLAEWVDDHFGRELQATSQRTLDEVATRLPKASGAFLLKAKTEQLEVSDLSLGASGMSMNLGQTELVGVELNPSGDAVEARFHLSESGALLVTVPGASVLQITYALAPVAADVVDLPAFASDDVVKMSCVDGTTAEFIEDADGAQVLGDESDLGPQLRVIAGQFSMESKAVPAANVKVAADQCLRQLDTMRAAHEMFGDMESGSCN